MIEVNCLKCKNCDYKNDCCLVYGKDANEATEKCADDNFKNYEQ